MFSPSMGPDSIPGMIDQGYRAIAVAFDVWSFSWFLRDSLKASREAAAKQDPKDKAGEGTSS